MALYGLSLDQFPLSAFLASWSDTISLPRPSPSVLQSPGYRVPQHFLGCTVVYQFFGVRCLAVLVTAQWKHPCSLEKQGRNKCFSHAINNVVGKDVVKSGALGFARRYVFLLSFFFLLPFSPTPFIQSDTEHLPLGIRGKQLCSKGKRKLNC